MIIGFCKYCKKEFRKREHKYKFCSLICSNNFNKNGLKSIQLPKYSSALAELVGICLGDGYISTYQTAITLNAIADKGYVPYVINLAKFLFPGVKLSIIYRKSCSAIDVRINSKIVAKFLLEMGIRPNNKKIPEWIFSRTEYKRACVRGLFDTEGSTAKKEYISQLKGTRVYYQLNFRNYDRKVMSFVRDVLIELSIKATLKPGKSLYLSNPNAISMFIKEIGFSNPKLKSSLASLSM